MAKAKAKETAGQSSNKKGAGAFMVDYSVILTPIITEKSSLVGGAKTSAVFLVNVQSTKTEIKRAVERIFDVKVKAVNTCNIMGKVKRTTGKEGRRADYKKAYVRLQDGYTIDLVEGV